MKAASRRLHALETRTRPPRMFVLHALDDEIVGARAQADAIRQEHGDAAQIIVFHTIYEPEPEGRAHASR